MMSKHRPRAAAALVLSAAAVCLARLAAADASSAATVDLAATTTDFCVKVQHALAGTTLEALNVIHTDYQAFRESKASIDPLTIHQYVAYADAGGQAPRRISCKTKSPDQLNEHFGAGSATASGRTCRDINRGIVMSVWRGLTPAERAAARDRPSNILLDADAETFIGSTWVSDFDHVYRDAHGRLRLFAKALRVDWDDWKFAWAPDSVRGVHYCHLVAPEYVRGIMRSDLDVPRSEP
jgi:hypothetical protein